MPDAQESDCADTHILQRVPTCNNHRHVHCMATGARYRPGAHRMRQRPERPTGEPVTGGSTPFWRRREVVQKLALATGLVNAVAAVLAAVTGSAGMLMLSLTLAVFSFVAYLVLADHDFR